jgi:hypothetical protein
MNKELLLEKYIKVAVKKALKEQEQAQQRAEKAMYLVYRFPGLKKVLEDVMSPAFGRYIKHIDIIAPKPTTFKITLINNQDFNVKYLGKDKFNVKVSGRQYHPDNLGESERCSQSIADLLELNYAPAEGKEQSNAGAEPSSSGGDFSGSTPEPTGPGAEEFGADLAAANTEPTPPAAEPKPEEETPEEA